MVGAAALRWEDVDVVRRVLHVRHTLTRVPKSQGSFAFTPPKTMSSRRVVPLNDDAVAALRAQRIAAQEARLFAGSKWEDHGLVFPNRVGKPLREDHVLAAFHQVCHAAGVPRKRLHDWRHFAASVAFANGAELRDVQDLLGHSRIDMTSAIYTASALHRTRDVVTRLGSVFDDAPESPDAAAGAALVPALVPTAV